MDIYKSVLANQPKSKIAISLIINIVAILALVAGIIMMYNYDQTEPQYIWGRRMVWISGVYITIVILFMIYLAYTLRQVSKMIDSDFLKMSDLDGKALDDTLKIFA